MSHFWEGFEKRAKDKKEEISPGRAALLAGGATTGGLATAHSLSNIYRDHKEIRDVEHSTFKKLKKQLKPGDIIFSRSPPGFSNAKTNVGVKLPLSNAFITGVAHGDPYYHASIYTGKGTIAEAQGSGLKATGARVDRLKGHAVKVYRPEGATKAEIRRAVEYAKKVKRKAPYTSTANTIGFGLKAALGVGKNPAQCRRSPSGEHVCTTVVTNAYDKRFKKDTMGPSDMRNTKGMKLIARHGDPRKITLGQRLATRVIHPLLRSAKWGLGAGALTYAGMKAKEMMDKNKSNS